MGTMTIDGRKVEFTDGKKCPDSHQECRYQYPHTVLSFRGFHLWCLSSLYS